MFGTKYDVFLSYSRQDSERVRPLRDALDRMGYRVFFDVQSIEPGEKWKTRLERSIRASRTLVLCWSEKTRGSEYITFEYSRAEALHKRVVPWKLDQAPLPAMLEVQGITATDAEEAAARLRPVLGWTLGQRRRASGIGSALAAALLALGLWLALRPGPPPPPWHFKGVVMDYQKTRLAGVEVDILNGNQPVKSTVTDAHGEFDIPLPQPKPESVRARFTRAGYQFVEENYHTSQPYWEVFMSKAQ
jgi:hypothetical protein